MPGLLIKDLPANLHRRLKERAAANRRSLQKEALVLLESALCPPAAPPSLEEIDRWRVRPRKLLTQELIERARTAGRR